MYLASWILPLLVTMFAVGYSFFPVREAVMIHADRMVAVYKLCRFLICVCLSLAAWLLWVVYKLGEAKGWAV